MFTFLDLPTELREMVYELCLVTDDIIIPKPTAWERAVLRQSPDQKRKHTHRKISQLAMNLLRTCKVIHAEASAVLYGRNRFRLPISQKDCRGTIFQRHAALFRHIHICFDSRDFPAEFGAELADQWVEEHPCCKKSSMCCAEHCGQRHRWMRVRETTRLIDIWAKKKLMRIPMTNLVSVILDFTNFEFTRLSLLRSALVTERLVLSEYFFTRLMSYWSYPFGFGDPHRLPKVYVVGLTESDHRAIMHGKWCFLSMEDLLKEPERLPGRQMAQPRPNHMYLR